MCLELLRQILMQSDQDEHPEKPSKKKFLAINKTIQIFDITRKEKMRLITERRDDV